MRVLFVTVDPDRDTPPILKAYVNAFSPEMDGLRGTDNAIAIAGPALSRRLCGEEADQGRSPTK